MRNLWLGVLLLAVESLAFGQLDPDTLTVSASQSFSLQPDQLIFRIYVTTPSSTSLDEVVAGLQGAGITAATLSNVGSSFDNVTLSWLFTLAVPFSKIQATVAQLTAQKIEFSVQGSQASAALQAGQQCPVPSMMADAKAQAKMLADAAELVVGDVLELSGGNALNGGQVLAQSQRPRAVAGTTTVAISTLFATPLQPVVRGTCSLTVKFKLLRYH